MIFYAGSRPHVYKGLITNFRTDIKIFALRSSFLHQYCLTNNIPCKTFNGSAEFHALLQNEISDKDSNNLLISSGIPFLINVRQYFCKFYNIHPSLLPSLKGRDPAIGAIINDISIGVSIHQMDENFDSGPIVWRSNHLNIPNDLDIRDLYAISFLQEYEAGIWLSKNLDSCIADTIKSVNDSSDIADSYFSRNKTYGCYDEEWSNLELSSHVRSAALNNYGIKIAFPTLNNSSHELILMSLSIPVEQQSLKNIFSASKLNNLCAKTNKMILVYQLENKALIYRNSQFISCTTREPGFYNLYYDTHYLTC